MSEQRGTLHTSLLPRIHRHIPAAVKVICMLLVVSASRQPATAAPVPASNAAAQSTSAAAQRDGAHDFDFKIGTWKTHIRRILDPLSGATHTIELNGTVTMRPVWGGRAAVEEIEADGPKGHWEGMTLFLYNPQAHQWSQSFLNSRVGVLSAPLVGGFKDGRGELFSGDTLDGQAILVRGVWSEITHDSHHYAESYSDDGGKSWALAFQAELTRIPDAGAVPAPTEAIAEGDGRRAFDFDFGAWKTHSSRLMHPLTGSTDWVDMDGGTVVRKLWGGRANLAEFAADGPAGHVELLALRWYNPATHQWSIDFATPKVGILGVPAVGSFRNCRGDFYDYEEINGRFVMVRFSIWGITADTGQSEQAFSDDGGKTWEVNWVNKYTRKGSQ